MFESRGKERVRALDGRHIPHSLSYIVYTSRRRDFLFYILPSFLEGLSIKYRSGTRRNRETYLGIGRRNRRVVMVLRRKTLLVAAVDCVPVGGLERRRRMLVGS